MTVKEAELIRTLLSRKEELEKLISKLEEAQHISGTITAGENGLGFFWGSASAEFNYLLDGAKKDLKDILQKIDNIQLEGL